MANKFDYMFIDTDHECDRQIQTDGRTHAFACNALRGKMIEPTNLCIAMKAKIANITLICM